MPALPKVLQLIKLFQDNADEYHAAGYNEATLCQQFIQPFFKCLGWDMENEQGNAPRYTDVIHQASLKVGGETKAPDYCFRISETPKFYLEAKKPSVSIKDDPAPAFQLRRYAWTAKMPLSILTNFAEFAVYDGRVKPAQTDNASAARILYCRFTDFERDWDQIVGVFSREAVLKGSFDKYADTNKAKRGTATVDAAFLEEIESWREELAKNLALRNPQLSSRELNFAVQITIDRIIFLRMCEDRGIERYGQLRELLSQPGIYSQMLGLYRKADERYNSGLFHFTAERGRTEPHDELTPRLAIDDKILKTILKNLYFPDSPYEFAVLPVEILGQVYEQFLGKIIHLTASHQAKVKDKPEVKKAGGVYYTPVYIVDYIVKNTVGKLLGDPGASAKGISSKQAAKLKILDPACGSGSFLLGAYDFLLKWHLDKYLAAGPGKHKKELYQTTGGDWRLTTGERKRILLGNIYGVDIDLQAVEVTKLSLLLKVLEGESQQTLDRQLQLFRERALPDLASNIKCGNSLIGPDFYDGPQKMLYEEEEQYRINVFDWNGAFPQITKAGGFDAVIGNPPYVRMELFKEIKDYLQDHYEAHDERTDLYVYFIEKSIKLLRTTGLYGVIVSNKWVRSKYGERLRKMVTNHAAIETMIDFGELPVFHNAATFPLILVARKASPGGGSYSFSFTPPFDKETFQAIHGGSRLLNEVEAAKDCLISSDNLSSGQWKLGTAKAEELLAKIRTVGQTLGKYTDGKIRYGIKTGLVEAFVIDQETRQRLIKQSPATVRLIKPYVIGDNIRKCHIRQNNRFLIYTQHGVDMRGCASVLRYLEKFKIRLQNRATKQEWYELQQPQQRYVPDYESPKIIYPDIAKESRFALDRNGLYPADTTFIIPLADLYLLGILNSRVVFFYLSHVCPVLGDARRGGRLRMKLNYVQDLPIPQPDVGKLAGKDRHHRMVELVEQMLALHRQLAATKVPQDKAMLQTRIAATDRQIDRLVYELYGLTEAEIRIVEEATEVKQ